MEKTEGLLETFLKRHYNEQLMVKVISVQSMPAVTDGENFCSEVKRLKLKIILQTGLIRERTVLLKILPTSELHRKFIVQTKLFRNEIYVYTNILNEMDNLMITYGDYQKRTWPKLFGYLPYEEILLEDLTMTGYKMADKRKCLDIKHASVVIYYLARFHAMSIILVDNDRIQVNLKKHPSLETSLLFNIMSLGFAKLAETMKNDWNSRWKNLANKLEILSNDPIPKLMEILQKIDGYLNVINHGDFWTNNMLFKYSPITNEPISIKFIDFQLSFYHCFVYDLTIFLHASLLPSVRYENYDYFMKLYRKTLIDTLEYYNYHTESIISLIRMKELMKEVRYLGMIFSLTMLPIIMKKSEELDLESFMNNENMNNTDQANVYDDVFKKEEIVNIIREDLEFYEKDGVFDD